MKKNVYMIASGVLLTFSALIYSCQEEFLEVNPHALTSAVFWETEADAQAALIGVYDHLQNYNTLEESYRMEWPLTGDMVSSSFDAFNTHNIQPTNGDINNVWRQHYTLIYRANTVIDRVPPMDINETVKQQIVGQAKFLRALGYFQLTRYFGDVPLILQESSGETDFNNFPRTPQAEVWAAIEADLSDAANDLPAEWTGADLGRADKGSALGLLAKAHLYQEEWPEVISVTERLNSEAPHQLVEDYADMFGVDNENTVESIFEVQYRDNSNGWGQDTNEGHFVQTRHGLSNGVNGGWGTWGSPTEQLYNAYEDGDTRRPFNVIRQGESHPKIDWVWPEGDGNLGGSATGYAFTKYWYTDRSASPDGRYAGNNIFFMRYAEVLLNYAEALNETGRTNEALVEVNKIRARGSLPPLSGLSQSQTLDAIFQERRVEFPVEASWWSELVRRGRAQQFLLEEYGINMPAFHNLMPIPQGELDINRALVQNPGYQ